MASTRLRDVGPWNHVRAVALLPFMNVVVIPALIVGAGHGMAASPIAAAAPTTTLGGALAVLLLLAGLALVARCIQLFVRHGNGTLAPWDPTRRLIAIGPYRFVRNPMKAGLFLILIGECLLLRSMGLVLWAGVFMISNVIYIRLSEEPGLRARFGRSYDEYCATVPRWWPRPTALRATAASSGRLR